MDRMPQENGLSDNLRAYLEKEADRDTLAAYIDVIYKNNLDDIKAKLKMFKEYQAQLDDVRYFLEVRLGRRVKITLEQVQRFKEREERKSRDLVPIKNKTLQALAESQENHIAVLAQQLKHAQEKYLEAKKAITADYLTSVYNFLEKQNSPAVAFLVEALVGLMRGQRRADTRSV